MPEGVKTYVYKCPDAANAPPVQTVSTTAPGLYFLTDGPNSATGTVSEGEIIPSAGIYLRNVDGSVQQILDPSPLTIHDFDLWENGKRIVVYYQSPRKLYTYNYAGGGEIELYDNSSDSTTTPRAMMVMRASTTYKNKVYLHHSITNFNWRVLEIDLNTGAVDNTLTGFTGITTAGSTLLASNDRIWSSIGSSSTRAIATWSAGSSLVGELHMRAGVGAGFIIVTHMFHEPDLGQIFYRHQTSGGAPLNFYGTLVDYDFLNMPFGCSGSSPGSSDDVHYLPNPSGSTLVRDYDTGYIYIGQGGGGIRYMPSPTAVSSITELGILHNGELLYTGEHGIIALKVVPK